MTQPDLAPLTGYRVAVTSVHRAGELSALLSGYGATVTAAPPVVLDGSDDDELRRQTEALIADPPDVLVATTAFGIRGWIAAADGRGLGNAFIAALARVTILSCGPKVTGALRTAGLAEEWSPESGSPYEPLRRLADSGAATLAGQRVVVQLPGSSGDWNSVPELLDGLRAAGAEVTPVQVYRWSPAPADGAFDRLLAHLADRQFDAVTFTSPSVVAATMARAGQLGIRDELLEALHSDVRVMCIGPATAAPLTKLAIPTSWPRRMRIAALARHVADELPGLPGRRMQAAGHRLEIRGSCVLVDGVVKALSPAEMATMRALAQQPGSVVARDDLLRVLPGQGTSAHAVETAVGRLRTALGDKDIVATVVKRGYRLAVGSGSGAA